MFTASLRELTFRENPVLVKDLRTRMRGGRAFLIMAVYTVILVGAFLVWCLNTVAFRPRWADLPADLGRQWFVMLFAVQMPLVIALMPALTAGSFTIEHEQRTFELMLLTSLKPHQMVWGRALSAAAFVALLATCSLPFAGLCFVLGGVTPGEVIVGYLTLILSGLLFASMGVAASCLHQRTVAATISAYMLLALYWGTVGLLAVLCWETTRWGSAPTKYIALAGVEPISCALYGSESGAFLGGSAPLWLVGFPFNALATWMFVTLGVNNFPYHRGQRAGLLRAQVWGLYLIAAMAFGGWLWAEMTRWVGSRKLDASDARDVTAVFLGVAAIATLVFLPLFSTKTFDRMPQERLSALLFGALSPRNFLRGGLRTAPGYVALWILTILPLTWVIFKVGGFNLFDFGVDYLWKTYLVVTVTVIFYVALGIYLSLALRPHRVAAGVILYVVMVLLLVFPTVGFAVAMESPYYYDDEGNRPTRQQTAPLWMETVYFFSSPASLVPMIWTQKDDPYLWRRLPKLRVPPERWWTMTLACYAGLTLLVSLLTVRAVERGRRG
jgi:ABC-type transport system involved in multi-copper enzyme maturation permease subunit